MPLCLQMRWHHGRNEFSQEQQWQQQQQYQKHEQHQQELRKETHPPVDYAAAASQHQHNTSLFSSKLSNARQEPVHSQEYDYSQGRKADITLDDKRIFNDNILHNGNLEDNIINEAVLEDNTLEQNILDAVLQFRLR